MTPFNIKITQYTHGHTKRTQWKIRSQYLKVLNDGGSPNERVFFTREAAVECAEKMKAIVTGKNTIAPELIDARMPAYRDASAEAKYFAGFAPVKPTWEDLPIEDQTAMADVPLIDPLLNAIDDAHKAISDATVDGDVAKLRMHMQVYSLICETLNIAIGSSQTP